MSTTSALTIDFITSLDGYGAAGGWPGFRGLEGPEYLGWLEEQAERPIAYLMGATTYREMAMLVEEGEPGTEMLAGVPKVVFSSTLTEPLAWPNTTVVRGDAVEAVRDEGQWWAGSTHLGPHPRVPPTRHSLTTIGASMPQPRRSTRCSRVN